MGCLAYLGLVALYFLDFRLCAKQEFNSRFVNQESISLIPGLLWLLVGITLGFNLRGAAPTKW